MSPKLEYSHTRPDGLSSYKTAPAKPTKEYGFDVSLFAVIRVQASSEEEARKLVDENAWSMDCNGGAWPSGDPILFNAEIEGTPTLIEVAGEAVE